MGFKKIIKPIPMVSLDTFAMPLATYVDITSGGLAQCCDFIRIRNDSKIWVFVSWDAVNVHDYIAAHSTLELVFMNTTSPGIYTPQISKGTIIYIGNFTGNVGLGGIYLSGFYQEVV